MGKSLDSVVFRSLSPIPHMNPTCGAKMASGIESHCCLTGAGDRHVTCLQPCVAAPCMHVRHRVVQNTPIVYYSPFCDFSGVLETNECKKIDITKYGLIFGAMGLWGVMFGPVCKTDIDFVFHRAPHLGSNRHCPTSSEKGQGVYLHGRDFETHPWFFWKAIGIQFHRFFCKVTQTMGLWVSWSITPMWGHFAHIFPLKIMALGKYSAPHP